MKISRKIAIMLVVVMVATIFGTASLAMATDVSHPYSQKIAMVPNNRGLHTCCSSCELPISGFPTTLPDGVTLWPTPIFINLHPDNIRDDVADPIVAGGFDTVVLNLIEDGTSDYLGNAQFMSRIESFVANGGKLIIYTSETADTPAWNSFIRPFTTDNPGATGQGGVLVIDEENSLSTNAASDYYIDAAAVAAGTDAAGDAIVFVTKDPNWCLDMTATNQNNVTGPAHCYSHYGSGLIIYNGLDFDDMDDPYGGGANSGEDYLERIWYLELVQPWNPTGLPCGVVVAPGQLTLEPRTATNPVNTQHCLVATLVDADGNPVQGTTVTFTVTGVNPTSGTAVTLANGEAEFCYTGTVEGTDTIVATCPDPAGGLGLKSNDAIKEWGPGGGPEPEVGGDIFPANKIALLAPWMALAVAVIAGTAFAFRRRLIKS